MELSFKPIAKQTSDKSGWTIDVEICNGLVVLEKVLLTGFFMDEMNAKEFGQSVINNRNVTLKDITVIATDLKELSKKLLPKPKRA